MNRPYRTERIYKSVAIMQKT